MKSLLFLFLLSLSVFLSHYGQALSDTSGVNLFVALQCPPVANLSNEELEITKNLFGRFDTFDTFCLFKLVCKVWRRRLRLCNCKHHKWQNKNWFCLRFLDRFNKLGNWKTNIHSWIYDCKNREHRHKSILSFSRILPL